MSKEYYQQGDLIIRRTNLNCIVKDKYISSSGLPWCTKEQRNIILEGEATGHNHEIVGTQYHYLPNESPTAQKIILFKNIKPVTIEHPEHKPIDLPPGEWRVMRVKEVDPVTGRERYIAD